MYSISDSNPLINEPSFLSYFCPFSSKNFDSRNKFWNLTTGQKVVTVAMTFFATLISFPILGLGGLAVFRAIVNKYTIGKLEGDNSEILLGGNDSNSGAGEGATKVKKFVADDMCLGFNSNNFQEENKKKFELWGLRFGDRKPLEGVKPKQKPTEPVDPQIIPETVHASRGRSNSLSASQASPPLNFLNNPSMGGETKDLPFVGEVNNVGPLPSGFPEPSVIPDPSSVVPMPSIDIKESLAAARDYLNKLATFDRISSENGSSIQSELTNIENNLNNYLTNEQTEKLISPLRADLVNTALVLDKLKKDYVDKKLFDDVVIVEALFQQIDRMITHLPSDEIIQGGFVSRLRGAIQQSEGKKISWKILKYEAAITNLLREFIENFGEKTLQQPPDLSSSWSNLSDPLEQVRKLYQILTSVPLKNTEDRYNQAYLKQIRKLYNDEFLPELRKIVGMLLETPTNDGDEKVLKEKEYLYKICEFLFTQINLEEESFETLSLFDEIGGEMLGKEFKPNSDEKKDPLIQNLNTLYTKLHAVPYSAKEPVIDSLGNALRGTLNLEFDPYRQGNPVHVLYRLKIGNKTVKALGMGTPTYEDSFRNVFLNPEFLGMLQSYKRQEKRHLYVSHQDAVPKTVFFGDETKRSNILLDQQDKEEYKDAYYAIALSKNSPFYYQTGLYANLNADAFKEELYRQVFVLGRDVSGCYIPDSLKAFLVKGERNKAKDIIEAVHQELFEGNKDLSVKERKDFIDHFYDNLIKVILVEREIDSFNLTCKDQVDRGAEANAKMYSNAVIVDEESVTEVFSKIETLYENETVLRIASLMMVRALFVKKRPPIKERFVRFSEGFEFGLKRIEKLKNLHKLLFKDLRIIPIGPEKKKFVLPITSPIIKTEPLAQNPPAEQLSVLGRIWDSVTSWVS